MHIHFTLDGYIPESDTAIEIMGCFHHGCPRCTSHSAPHSTQKGKTFGEGYHESESRNKKVQYLVSHLEVQWECEFLQGPYFQTYLAPNKKI